MEGAGTWKAERERPNQSSTTARPAYRITSTGWLGLQSPNLLHKHAEVATKNWALRWTDGGHHRNQKFGPESSSKCSESVACIVGNWSGTKRAADRLADGD